MRFISSRFLMTHLFEMYETRLLKVILQSVGAEGAARGQDEDKTRGAAWGTR